MWTSNSMTFFESLQTFAIGFSIVFICLISLAIFIIISSKIIEIIEKSLERKAKATSITENTEISEEQNEELAVIISAISEEMNESVENFRIVSIKQI